MAICCGGGARRALAEVQPDRVGPPGEFEEAVAALMALDEDMTLDVAEMLVAAEALRARDGDGSDKLRVALETEDELQREAAELYDRSYDLFLDLYPQWRMYVLCEDPVEREKLYAEYLELLARYEQNQEELIADLGILLNLEKALLPSNAYVDPYGRILPSVSTAEILKDFDPDQLDQETDEETAADRLPEH